MRARPLTFAFGLLGLLVSSCGGLAPPPHPHTDTSTSTDTSKIPLTIVQFDPPGGSVSAPPTSVVITFNEGIVNAQGNDASNFVMVCPSAVTAASSAAVAFTAVTVTFPTITATSGTRCSLIVAPGLQNGNGGFLRGNRQADYQIN